MMSGHSKWHNIQKKKGVTDARRSREFTVVARAITAAVKKTGIADPDQNPSLRLALEKARAVNMPNLNVERAIRRGSGKSDTGASLEEILYEAYGPSGVGFLILVHTDNKQRTGAEIRNIFSSRGGALAGPGAAAYLFTNVEGEYSVSIPLPLSQEQFFVIDELTSELEAHDDVDGVWHNGSAPLSINGDYAQA